MQLNSLIEDYLRFLKEANKSPNTIRNYASLLDRFLHHKDEISNTKFDFSNIDVTKLYVRSFYEKEIATQKQNTKCAYYSALNSFFNWLIEEAEVMDKNPLKGNRIPKPKVEDVGERALSPEDKKRFTKAVEALPLGLKAACLLVQELGVRAVEVCELNLNSVFITDFGLQINVKGKGGKYRLLPLYKTSKSYQVVKHYLVQELKTRDKGPLFLHKGKRLQYSHLYYEWKNKVSSDFTPHQLRHTVGTDLINHGADIFTVKELLGHSNINTSNRYARKAKNLMDKDIERFQGR